MAIDPQEGQGEADESGGRAAEKEGAEGKSGEERRPVGEGAVKAGREDAAQGTGGEEAAPLAESLTGGAGKGTRAAKGPPAVQVPVARGGGKKGDEAGEAMVDAAGVAEEEVEAGIHEASAEADEGKTQQERAIVFEEWHRSG